MLEHPENKRNRCFIEKNIHKKSFLRSKMRGFPVNTVINLTTQLVRQAMSLVHRLTRILLFFARFQI